MLSLDRVNTIYIILVLETYEARLNFILYTLCDIQG